MPRSLPSYLKATISTSLSCCTQEKQLQIPQMCLAYAVSQMEYIPSLFWAALSGFSRIIKTLIQCDTFTSLAYWTWILVPLTDTDHTEFHQDVLSVDWGKNETALILYKLPPGNHTAGLTHCRIKSPLWKFCYLAWEKNKGEEGCDRDGL